MSYVDEYYEVAGAHPVTDLLAAGFAWRDWKLTLTGSPWAMHPYRLTVQVPSAERGCDGEPYVAIYSFMVPDEGPYGLWLIRTLSILERLT